MAGIKSYVPAFFGALAAGLIVLFDTTIWLSICFAFAGPMILSGLYEAMLDSRVLEFLREKIQNKRLTLDMRCRCLMLILIGNLDLTLEPESLPHQHCSTLLPVTSGVSPSTTTDARSRERDQSPRPLADSLGVDESHSLTETRSDLLAARTPTPGGATTSSTEHDVAHQPITTLLQRQNLAPDNSHSHSRRLGTTTSKAPTICRRPTAQMAASPWRHMEVLLYDLRLYDDDDHIRSESPRQWARQLCEDGEHCGDIRHGERPRPWTLETKGHIARTKTRLRTMLHCQYSFGSVVGAPVIFFLGGFLFAFLSSLDNLGDEDIAESIAFGSWYMIIPHIAIVSGLLLAGNNPNILEGVFATERDDQVDAESATTHLLFGLLRFELVYPSCYKVAWQWLRGHTKKQWINQLLHTYTRRVDINYEGQVNVDDDLEDLRAKTSLSPLDWFFLLSLTFLLLGVPFLLAFLTAFFTPQTGLSCRSLTFAIYFCIQVAQIGLWLWAYAGAPPALVEDGAGAAGGPRRGFHPLNLFHRGGWLDTSGFYAPASASWLLKENGRSRTAWEVVRSSELWSFRAMWCGIYYFLSTALGLGAVFSSLGGTVMQIMGKLHLPTSLTATCFSCPGGDIVTVTLPVGVYRTAMCYVNVQHWLAPIDQRPMVVLSTNSQEMINNSIGERSASTPASLA